MADTPASPASNAAGPEMLSAILQTAVGAIIVIDQRGIIQNVNPACQRMFGFSEQDLLGHNISMLMPEPHRAQHDHYIHHHMRTGEKRIIGIGREMEGLRRDGTTFWMHLAVSAFSVAGEQYFAGTIIDLDSRKRREALVTAVFEHIPDAIVVTDLDQCIIQCNTGFSRIFGYSPTEVQGRSARLLFADSFTFERLSILPPDTADKLPKSYTPVSVEMCRTGGTVFPAVAVFAAVRDPNQRVIAMLSVIRDATVERAQAAALSKAQRMEAYGHLTGGVAHDFNNLLTIITGNQELLELRLKEERDLALLKRAQHAAEMAARLTARLLTFARRRQLEPVILNLNEMVLGMSELLRRTLGEPIQMSAILSSTLWPTKADPSEIENAILNLAINSRDAMPMGGRLVIETSNVSIDGSEPEVTKELAPGDYVRISVADTGTGMSSEVLARAVEPFYTTKEPGRGTGLGLSTIYGFAKQSGGGVSIYSEIGQGAVVNVYLPRATGIPSQSPKVERTPIPVPQNVQTILVVEDNPGVREVTIARLKNMGYATIPAESGPAAVEVLEDGASVDLVFSDVVMAGGMSGYDVAAWIKNKRPDLPVLLASGFVTEIARGDIGANEDYRILRKPYNRDELEAAVTEALEASAGIKPSAQTRNKE